MKSKLDTLGRRNRMRPQSTGKRVTLQERDWLWLEKLHRHGPLASSYLLEFAKDLGRSEKRAKERLTDLFNEDNTAHGGPYLTRPPQQFQTIDSRYNQLVYDLAPAGTAALKERKLWQPGNATLGGPWWHQFMVSSITASIELAVAERDDLIFIPQTDILTRANTGLSCPVSYIDPVAKKTSVKGLQPDAIFGLEYCTGKGRRFRFFAVEADRGTEPLTSANSHRKSVERNIAQYHALIANRAYQRHYKLTAPLLVLIVTTGKRRLESAMKAAINQSPILVPAVLHQYWEDFAAPLKIPAINRSLVRDVWLRADGFGLSIGR